MYHYYVITNIVVVLYMYCMIYDTLHVSLSMIITYILKNKSCTAVSIYLNNNFT